VNISVIKCKDWKEKKRQVELFERDLNTKTDLFKVFISLSQRKRCCNGVKLASTRCDNTHLGSTSCGRRSNC
jgi:hypothetical protein